MVGRTALRKIGGFSLAVGMVLTGLSIAAAPVTAAPTGTPAAAPAVAAAELPKTGRELGLAARAGGVLIALGLMAMAASGKKREATAVR